MSTKQKQLRPAAKATTYRDRKELWTYWLSRDSDPKTGAVSAKIDVWLSRPMRYEVGERGCFWLANGGMADHFAKWSTDECLGACRVYPDDDRQSIRVGPEEDARPASRKEEDS